MDKQAIVKQVVDIIKKEFTGSSAESKANKKNHHFTSQLKDVTEEKIDIEAPIVVEGRMIGNYTAEGGSRYNNDRIVRRATINCDFESNTELYEVSKTRFSDFRLTDVAKEAHCFVREKVVKHNDRESIAIKCGEQKAKDEFDKYNYEFFEGRLRKYAFIETGERVELPIFEVSFNYVDENGRNKSIRLGEVSCDESGQITKHYFGYKAPLSKRGKRKLVFGLIFAAILVVLGLVFLPML